MAPLQMNLAMKLIVSFVLFAGCPSATLAQVITSSDLRNGFVCPGMVSFTCETRGSFAIAWTSDDYIGTGGTQLIFATGASVVGDTRSSGGTNGTVANLTHNAVENGVRVLVSTLNITVEQNSPGGSVTCMHIGDGAMETIDFEVIAAPGVPRDVFAVQIEHVMDDCIVTVFWRSPNDTNTIRGYKTSANGTNLSNDTIISATSDDNEIISTLLSVPGCFVHFVSVSAINECGRVGPESHPVRLDPEDRHMVNVTSESCNAVSGSKSNQQPGSFITMMVMTVTYIIYYYVM